MKNLIFILFIFFNYSTFSKTSDVPRLTYKIIIKNALTADENFNFVGRALIENDYQIETKDKDFYTIKSSPREIYKSRPGSYFLTFAVKNNEIDVTGQFACDIDLIIGVTKTDNSYSKICLRGMSGSIGRDAFIRMSEFAKKLGTEFEYITE